MWNILTDVEVNDSGRVVVVQDPNGDVAWTGACLFDALAYLYDKVDGQFRVEGQTGFAAVQIDVLEDFGNGAVSRPEPLPPGVKWIGHGEPGSPTR